jgi:regulator of protease activity HflC (stomatin/prohibitin superfamily)
MPYVYGVEIKDAETEGKVPINMWIEVEAVIFNPYKAMFQIKDWNAAMTSWIEGASRDFVSKNSYEEIIRGELSSSLENHISKRVEKIIERYGVKITNLSVIQVVPSNAEYEQATQQKVVEERKMEATLVRARADAQKEAIARMGSALSMVASATGQTVEKLQQELETSPEVLDTKYKKQFKVAMDLVNKNMAIDGKAYFEMKLPKGSGTGGGADYSNMIGAIIAANKIIEQQKTSPSLSSSSSTKEEKKKIYSREEIDALIAEADKNRSRK